MLAPWAQLAAVPSESTDDLVILLVVAGGLLIAWALVERRRRQLVERRIDSLAARVHAGQGDKGDDIQRRLGELHVLKMEAELAMLQRQLSEQHGEADRLEASKEFHELMVEKTRLEMDSMRLHIAEQRRRIDDWHGTGPE
jgi:hypothetical protein